MSSEEFLDYVQKNKCSENISTLAEIILRLRVATTKECKEEVLVFFSTATIAAVDYQNNKRIINSCENVMV